MNVERFVVNNCCGRTSLVFKIDQPLSKKHLSFFIANGFNEASHFTAAGILYVDNSALVVTGPFGSDRLTVKCKIDNCISHVNTIEELLRKLEEFYD